MYFSVIHVPFQFVVQKLNHCRVMLVWNKVVGIYNPWSSLNVSATHKNIYFTLSVSMIKSASRKYFITPILS